MSNYIRTGRLMYPLGDEPGADVEHGITGAGGAMLTGAGAGLIQGAGGGAGTPSQSGPGGLPSWALPVAIGAGLFYFITRR